MLSTDIGIDLGTSNILIFVKKRGIILNEPCIVAIESNTNKILAVGKKANEMYEKTPNKIKVVKPLKDGVIADMEIAEIMLSEFIKMLKIKNLFIKPKILICCPTNITPLEKENIKTIAELMGARKIYIEEEPKMAAVGAGLNIKEPKANMIIDIGGGTTDIAVLSLNNVVTSSSINIAGNKLNDDIISYIKEKYKLLIGTNTAEKLKKEFANVYTFNKNKTISVNGKNILTGLPSSINITEEDLNEALKESINRIIKEIIKVLEQTPPELVADIVKKGIILTGGGALLKGLIEVLEENINVSILIAESPLTCVIEGTGMTLEELK